jgi:hypothetical protein
MQYTLRGIPKLLDHTLRERARQEGKSLNEVAVQALERGSGLEGEPIKRRDLRDLAGRWREDPEFDRAIADQDRVDPELWP